MPDMGSLVRNYQHLFPHFAHSWVTLVGLAILIYASLLATLWLVCRLRGRPGVFRDCAMLVLVSALGRMSIACGTDVPFNQSDAKRPSA